MDAKPFWKSKNFWLSLANAVLLMEPTTQEIVKTHPVETVAVVNGLFFLLRFFTGQPVSLTGSGRTPITQKQPEPTTER